jgi:hypothetical protein
MSIQVTRTEAASPALHTFVAGIIGAIGTDAFISIAHQTSPVKVWQFIASAVFGPVAYASPQYAAIGPVLHLITALFWRISTHSSGPGSTRCGTGFSAASFGADPELRDPWSHYERRLLRASRRVVSFA